MTTAEILFKADTGYYPKVETILEFEIWRSKGQWIVHISDEEKFNIWGNRGLIEITLQDQEYINWLEEKIEQLTRQTNGTKQ